MDEKKMDQKKMDKKKMDKKKNGLEKKWIRKNGLQIYCKKLSLQTVCAEMTYVII